MGRSRRIGDRRIELSNSTTNPHLKLWWMALNESEAVTRDELEPMLMSLRPRAAQQHSGALATVS
jgi:hypothetical protein